jgi:hypothetical protein
MNETRETTINKLTVGDIVFAINGKPRPFPYEVTNVIEMAQYGVTRVDFAHGGIVPPCNSTTRVTVAVLGE